MLTPPTRPALVVATFLAFGVLACKEGVEPGDFPYEEKIVIRAVLEAGKPVQEIFITRTLSLTELYTPEKAAIADVKAEITIEGASYPLSYVGPVVRGNVKTGFAEYTAVGLTAKIGGVYRLSGNWNGHEFWAQTSIPDSTNISNSYMALDSSEHSLRLYRVFTTVKSKTNFAYTANYEHKNLFLLSTSFGSSLLKASADGEIVLTSSFATNSPSTFRDSLYVKVFTFDEAFYDYYRTRNGGRAGNVGFLFSGGPSPVNWNAEGDAIGLFIGMSTSRKNVFVPF
jgi:hypothetical protein